MAKKMTAALLTVMGFLFITAYIRSATVDVVYTDYMRIINTYLPNVADPEPYTHADVLERIPITFIERLFNVKVLGYSTTFDMLLGALGLAMCSALIGCYCVKKNVRAGLIAVFMFIVFSLDKWEMLTNGTGWMHFWAMALFYAHFLIYDSMRALDRTADGVPEKGKRRKRKFLLLALPSLIIFMIAGPYCAAYSGCVCLIYFLDCGERLRSRKRAPKSSQAQMKDDIKSVLYDAMPYFASVLIPFGLYFLSHMSLEYEYAGTTTMSLTELIASDPGFLPGLLIRSFAGLAITGETAQAAGLPDVVILCEGVAVMIAYAVALILNIRTGLYKKSAFPMMLMIMALLSHGLIVGSRWIFADPTYSMSSRYALQYMGGSIGILMTLFYACENRRGNIGTERDTAVQVAKKRISATGAFTCGMTVLILSGQFMNCAREIHMAPYRKEAFENMRETAVNYEERTDDELKRILQYSDPAKTRSALDILKENRWNVFRDADGSEDEK